MTMRRRVRKDHVAAILLVAMGITILVLGTRYRMGTLVHMGAGYIPVVLGILMTAVGLLIGLLAKARTPEEQAEQALPEPPDLRGVICILAASPLSSCWARTAVWFRRPSRRSSLPRWATGRTPGKARRCSASSWWCSGSSCFTMACKCSCRFSRGATEPFVRPPKD